MGLWARLTGRERHFVAASAPSYRNTAVIDRIVKDEAAAAELSLRRFAWTIPT